MGMVNARCKLDARSRRGMKKADLCRCLRHEKSGSHKETWVGWGAPDACARSFFSAKEIQLLRRLAAEEDPFFRPMSGFGGHGRRKRR